VAEPGLHTGDIFSKAIFPRQLGRVLKMVNLLMVLQLLVNLWLLLETDACPQNVPVVLVSLLNILGGENLLQNLGFRVDELEACGFILLVVLLQNV
jgi:hypothetical protein